MKTKEDVLSEELKKFKKTSGVTGSAILRRDGIMVISDFPFAANTKGIAAMTAAIVGTSETASNELKMGEMQEVSIETSKGKLISIGAGPEFIIVALAKKSAKTGAVTREMKKISDKIIQLIM